MAEVVRMPKMSDTMTEGVLAKWHKKVGDKVKPGDLVAEIETDKATMDFESFQEGTLLYVGIEEGKAVPVDAIIAVLGEEGEDYKSLLEEDKGDKKSEDGDKKTEEVDKKSEDGDEKSEDGDKESEEEDKKTEEGDEKSEDLDKEVDEKPAAENSSSDSDSRVKASPLAKKLAEEKGVDISKISGSADGGRIIKRDVENFKKEEKTESKEKIATSAKENKSIVLPSVIGEESYDELAVSQMRKTIARRLAESKFTAPHFYLTISIDMDQAIAARAKINEMAPVKISFNDLVVKAVAVALRQHPNVNSSWLGDKIRINHHVNIGVAVAVEDGLLVPVVRFADNKSLSHIAVEVKEFAQKAKDKKLQPSDWEGSTFTISNLGMFGIDQFTAIINPPDACILAVGGISQVPVVKNGAVVPGNVMKVTLSCDHRVVDGASGAAFLQTFKQLLEEPVRMLV